MTIEEWAKDFKSFVNELQMPRDDYKGIMEYIDDALALLKEQEDALEQMRLDNTDLRNCNAELMKAQEAVEQKTGHWIWLQYCANEGVYCSECHTKMFGCYPMKKKLSLFCGHCGAKMGDEVESR